MFPEDVRHLVCPRTHEPLSVAAVDHVSRDGEVLDGELVSPSGARYPIRNGIPRFVRPSHYNETWERKWTHIDAGRGLNYKIVDRADPAFEGHNILVRNDHGGRAFDRVRDGLVLDLGCGIGQYTYQLLREHGPAKVVAMDLTGGVDVFRKVMLERFPDERRRILMVQASVFEMPFPDGAFDYVMSLGVLHHTGDTLNALRQACRVLREGGHLNIWVYASDVVPFEARESGRRRHGALQYHFRSPHEYFRAMVKYTIWRTWLALFRRLPDRVVERIIRLQSSEVYYRLHTIPFVRRIPMIVFPTLLYPDFWYRFINNWDGWRNTWADHWNEDELFPILKEGDIVIRGISDWRLGIWGEKRRDWYGP